MQRDKGKTNDSSWKFILSKNTALDKNSLILRVKSKIKKVSDHRRIVELKYYDIKWWYDLFNIMIIFISAVLTIIEAVKNDLDVEELDEGKKHFFKLTPLIISTSIGFISSYMKFKRYQENLEFIARTTEKGIFTIYRMKKLIEDLHFANDAEFVKKRQLYLEEIFNLYNQTQSELQKTHTFKEIILYTNKLNKIELEGDKNNILNENKYKKLKEMLASEEEEEDFVKNNSCSIGNINDDNINDDGDNENFSYNSNTTPV